MNEINNKILENQDLQSMSLLRTCNQNLEGMINAHKIYNNILDIVRTEK